MSADDDLNEQAKDLMGDHLELMKEVVMRIREDEEFARNIYADCPRLQALLDRNPDLRPIFEDPNLVRINFEQVYKDAGGVLPEDEKPRTKCLTWLVNSPIFKVLRLLLMVKKVMGCIAGGGIGMVTGFFMGLFCCGEDSLPTDFDPEGDDDIDGNPENELNKQSLNNAADYMENPEVQEQMEKLMEDPEGLEDAIENDEELRALRDSNPLCAELMSDPETMKILTDPENLRALGEAPDLIEADFADPNWSAPDIEMGDGDYDMDMDGEVDADADGEVDAEAEEGEELAEEEDDDGAVWEEAELEQQEAARERGGRGGNAPRQQQQQKTQASGEGGVGASIATCARDLAAGAIVGHLLGADIFGGGGDDLGGLEEAADGMDGMDAMDDLEVDEDALDEAAEGVDAAGNDIMDNAAATANMVAETEFADTLEEGMDGGEDAMGEHEAAKGAATGGAAGAAAGGTAGAMADGKQKDGEDVEEEEKKGGWFGNMSSAVFSAAKEQMAAAVLGDDLAEMLVEKMEEKSDDEDDDDDDKSDDEKSIDEEEDDGNRRNLLQKNRT